MDAQSPDGYTLPKTAAHLVAHAERYGWAARAIWVAGYEINEPFVHVDVGRRIGIGEADPVDAADPYAPVRGNGWRYRVTWHSRGCPPGKLKLFRQPLASTPWRPHHHDGPSVKAIREVIARHPRPAV